jgi:tRNA(Arg) A34 adenosine deaminase TadA
MNDAHPFATQVNAQLPNWLVKELHLYNRLLPTHEERVRLTNRLAARNYKEGNGGPFAAIVVDHESGELVSLGVNVVLSSGLSSVHAEVMALSLAQARLGAWDLGSHGHRELELVVNWRPCTMCYGALVWSGVKHLLIAGEGPECEELTGFDEGPMPENWRAELEGRGISVTSGVLREDAIAVFTEYGRSGSIVYNARGTGSRLQG